MKRIREKPPARKRRDKNFNRGDKTMKSTHEKPPAPNDLDHINEIIKNARATWFVLLGALVFAAVTLAGIKDVAFLVPDLETKLPLAGISVPVMSFFWAGALLVAALYIYFHLYLEKLWQALGEADAEINGKLLADQIHPWLVSDSALRMRDWLRRTEDISTTGDSRGRRFIKRCLNRLSGRLQGETTESPCSRSRGMSWISGIVSFSLVWLFGLVVIFWFWWRSMPAHELYLTGWLGLVLAATLGVFLQSALGSLRWLAASDWSSDWSPKGRLVYPVFLICIIGLTIVRSSWDPWAGEPRRNLIAPEKCTMEAIASGDIFWCRLNFRALLDPLRPASANLRGVVFTRKPEGWLGKNIEKAEYRAKWCNQHGTLACQHALDPAQTKFAEAEGEEEERFESAWKIYWNARLSAFEKIDLRTKDLRGADLRGARLQDANLEDANLEDANLEDANLTGADLRGARLQDANLEDANLTGANLRGARLQDANLEDANLRDADLRDANLRDADLTGADLTDARLEGADLFFARLQGANLTDAHLEGASLFFARLQGADLTDAHLEGADLRGAQLEGAHLEGADLRGAQLEGANLRDADLTGANLTDADLTGANFRGADLTDAQLEGPPP